MNAPHRSSTSSASRFVSRWAPLLAALLASCAAPVPVPSPAPAASAPARDWALPAEHHLANLRALTMGGENAEAYWSWAGDQLILQARPAGDGCDRIYRVPAAAPANGALPRPVPVSDGRGATTCSYFLPGDKEVIFASTEGGAPTCPPRPDRSQGYVWALYPDYDIYRAGVDGAAPRRLTTTRGYDAEGTVCAKDGSIVFTSVRDGDIDLYRMDADGQNVRRLTHDVGYDGGAFFNSDCTRIVWRASRPKPGKELDDYKRLLAQNLVRPTKLELYVANADGSDATQVTYLDAASFGPAWQPGDQRLVFASNYGDPRGREFDIWAIDVQGTRLERITAAPGFDGFPLFSPDGTRLAFSSNRATPAGQHDTNVFLADWRNTAVAPAEELPADRVAADVRWLADPAREGRGVGTAGLAAAGAYIEDRFRALGLQPAGDGGTYRQAFEVRTGLAIAPATRLEIAGAPVAASDFVPSGFSSSGHVKGPLALAGYGLRDTAAGVDDYAHLDVKGKVVLVRRFAPEGAPYDTAERARRAGDVRQKAWNARERGARALIVVDLPTKPANAAADWRAPDEAALSKPRPEGYGDAGLPVLFVKRAVVAPLLEKLEKRKAVTVDLEVALTFTTQPAFNVVGRLPGGARPDTKEPDANGPKGGAPAAIVIGAHYDHLGYGDQHSLAPDSHLPHLGADDNASGTAGVLEAARQLAARAATLPVDVLFVAFSGEESGVLGSSHFTRTPPPGVAIADLRAMINLDMVGRLRDNKVTVFGTSSADEWKSLVEPACAAARIDCAAVDGGGFGPSDQMPFYAAGVPVVHFFTGSHGDYHKPSDTAAKINAAGAGQIATAVAALATAVATRPQPLSFRKIEPPAPEGDTRSFNASLGTVPDYAGPPAGASGVLLAGVRPGGAAEKGGLKRGDILIRLGLHDISSVEDLMFALNASKPGETVTAVVKRDGHDLRLPVTFTEGHRPK
ncbi:MAG TPA: M20/M25/M40 family metallo-hydrolase [Polyangia bacterium]|nr:M20/M25/M40 family metallo-hydrolase [Polyangia bacterium]